MAPSWEPEDASGQLPLKVPVGVAGTRIGEGWQGAAPGSPTRSDGSGGAGAKDGVPTGEQQSRSLALE